MSKVRIFRRIFTVGCLLALLISPSTMEAQNQQVNSPDQTNAITVTPELIGQIGGAAYAVALQGDYAYTGAGQRLLILNVSNPSLPKLTGWTDLLPEAITDVAVVGDYAYIADYESGLRIIDVSDPTSPTEAGFYDTSSYAEALSIVGNYAYVADGWDGLRVHRYFYPDRSGRSRILCHS